MSRTALWTAWLRERETSREHPLVHDPFAGRLLTDADREVARAFPPLPLQAHGIVVRHAWFDLRLFRVVGDEGLRVVVELGAGLDTRPWRIAWPRDLEWTDVDHEAILAMKAERLAGETPRCVYRALAADLSREGALDAIAESAAARAEEIAAAAPNGARRAPFPLFLAEGVLPWLSEDQVRALLRTVRRRARRCLVLCDVASPWFVRRHGRKFNDHLATEGAALRFATADPVRFFASEGFSTFDARPLAEAAIEARRPPLPSWLPLPRFVREMSHLVLAQSDPLG